MLRRRDESGETLVELLVTMVVVGLTVAAILGALVVSITSSTQHRNLATDDNLEKSALEAIKSQVELSSPSKFEDCSASKSAPQILADWSPGGSNPLSIPPPPSGSPSGYSVWLSSVACWNPLTGNFESCSPCTAADTSGLVQVTVSAQDPSGFRTNLSTVVRNPSFCRDYDYVYASSSTTTSVPCG